MATLIVTAASVLIILASMFFFLYAPSFKIPVLGLMSFWSYANVTVGQTCVNDNTVYTAYKDDGSAYAFIVSRDK